jgi:uncharacterized protein (DUF1810 family)
MEVKAGKKQNHWMWFIFPQLPLGKTSTSIYYSILSREEAVCFLNHPVLGQRPQEITEAVLYSQVDSTFEIFGEIDSLKLRSCMTLFSLVSGSSANSFQLVLEKYYHGTSCEKTIEWLSGN